MEAVVNLFNTAKLETLVFVRFSFSDGRNFRHDGGDAAKDERGRSRCCWLCHGRAFLMLDGDCLPRLVLVDDCRRCWNCCAVLDGQENFAAVEKEL